MIDDDIPTTGSISGKVWIDADENGKIFKRAIGSDEKIYINSNEND